MRYSENTFFPKELAYYFSATAMQFCPLRGDFFTKNVENPETYRGVLRKFKQPQHRYKRGKTTKIPKNAPQKEKIRMAVAEK